MKLSSFLCLILVLTALVMQTYSATRHIYSGVREYQEQVTLLKEQRDQDRLKMALERELQLEFRENVAALMPGVLKKKGEGEKGYPYRSLASTVARGEAENVRKAIAKTIFERGRDYFRKKNFSKSKIMFKQVIDKYGYTPFVAESFFLLAESHFQAEELEQSTAVIKQMVELFPQHELTGFALIRLGRIYEMQNRNEEAVEIYKTVLRSYPQRAVASQAKASLRGVDQ